MTSTVVPSGNNAAPFRVYRLDGLGIGTIALHRGRPSAVEIALAAPGDIAAGADDAHVAHDLRMRAPDPLGDEPAGAQEPRQLLSSPRAARRQAGQLARGEPDIPG